MEIIAVRDFGKKIVEGEIYEVLNDKTAGYKVKDEQGKKLWYPKSIFEVVEEEIELGDGDITREELINTPDDNEELSEEDKEEWDE